MSAVNPVERMMSNAEDGGERKQRPLTLGAEARRLVEGGNGKAVRPSATNDYPNKKRLRAAERSVQVR